MKKIFNKIYNFFYSLPFSMKAGELLNSQTSSSDNNVVIQQGVTSNRLSLDLLKGEVTQQVEELRYRDYAISEASRDYKYISEGVAIKKNISRDKNKYSFKQYNKLICEGVLDELQRIGEYGNERYTLSITYDGLPKYKLESYCYMFEINVFDDECVIKLHFDTIPNASNFSSKSFLNELEKIFNIDNSFEYKRQEICSNIDALTFVTYRVDEEKDLTKYSLFNLDFWGITKTPLDYVLEYRPRHWMKEYLIDKFYSKSMDEKYKKKEKKQTTLQLGENKRTRYCSECGTEISVYDGDITESTIGKTLCTNCLENYLKNN